MEKDANTIAASRAHSGHRTGLIVVGAGSVGVGVAVGAAKLMPTTLIDKSLGAEDLSVELRGGRVIHGDGTSMIVLREARLEQAYALVAATSDDEINLEVCRLGVTCGVPEVLCRIGDADRVEEVMSLGAHPVTAAAALTGALLALLPGVAITTSEVGLGHGEVVQVRVMAGALVVGKRVVDIATREFLIAAIYRGGRLIVPHGDTVVLADDQVLLVGDPDTVRAVAEGFRIGDAQFPRQFGRTVVVYDPWGSESVSAEAGWLREECSVQGLKVGVAGRAGSPTAEGELPLSPRPKPLLALAPDAHPALFVLPAPRRWLWRDRHMGPLRSLLDRTEAPLLVARATFPYRSILVPVSDSESAWEALDLAVDVARAIDARVTALHVRQPHFLSGSAGQVTADRIERRVQEIARLYELDVRFSVIEGNPVKVAVDVAAEHQLVVLTRRRGRGDSYVSPDVGLRIFLGVPCSALLSSRR